MTAKLCSSEVCSLAYCALAKCPHPLGNCNHSYMIQNPNALLVITDPCHVTLPVWLLFLWKCSLEASAGLDNWIFIVAMGNITVARVWSAAWTLVETLITAHSSLLVSIDCSETIIWKVRWTVLEFCLFRTWTPIQYNISSLQYCWPFFQIIPSNVGLIFHFDAIFTPFTSFPAFGSREWYENYMYCTFLMLEMIRFAMAMLESQSLHGKSSQIKIVVYCNTEFLLVYYYFRMVIVHKYIRNLGVSVPASMQRHICLKLWTSD